MGEGVEFEVEYRRYSQTALYDWCEW